MTRRRLQVLRVALSAVMLACALLVADYLSSRSSQGIVRSEASGPESAPDGDAAATAVQTSAAPLVTSSQATGASPETVPAEGPAMLPDVSEPLVLQLPLLIASAKTGDPHAACRIVLSLNRCTTAFHRKAFSERAIRSMQARKEENESFMIDLLARGENARSGDDGYCKGVDPATIPSADSALRNAMPALSPRQKTIIAMLRSDGHLRRLVNPPQTAEPSTYVVPDIISSNQHAFLLAGFEARDALALEGLIMMHSPGSAIMSQGAWVVQPDVRRFLKYSLLMARLYGPSALGDQGNRAVAAASASVSADELRALGREAEAEAQRWAASRGRSGLQDGDVLAREWVDDEPLRLCAE